MVVAKRRLTGSLADRIRHLLEERGAGVAWLARETGVHRVTISRIVGGVSRDLPLSTLTAVATALGVSVGELVDDLPPD
ncbi:MAG: helix-turn-helix transcriptional regulator [Gemmataceae bacterium]